MRNIHFQSLKSSSFALPGNGFTSLPSPLPMKPLAPRRRIRPYSLIYSDFHSCVRNGKRSMLRVE